MVQTHDIRYKDRKDIFYAGISGLHVCLYRDLRGFLRLSSNNLENDSFSINLEERYQNELYHI